MYYNKLSKQIEVTANKWPHLPDKGGINEESEDDDGNLVIKKVAGSTHPLENEATTSVI